MAGPSLNVVTGIVKATGALITVRTVGFRPKTIKTFRAGAEGYWQKGMADASACKRQAAGTGSVVTVGGFTPLADGFTIGTDADLNPAGGTDIHYTVTCE